MPRTAGPSIPKYRRRRASGQAVVTLGGKDHYLGPHGSKASQREYDRRMAGRRPHIRKPCRMASRQSPPSPRQQRESAECGEDERGGLGDGGAAARGSVALNPVVASQFELISAMSRPLTIPSLLASPGRELPLFNQLLETRAMSWPFTMPS